MAFAAISVAIVWLATTCIFWVGYVGSDDLAYARYAFFLHRPPINWWEFRIPAILAIRANFLAFGPSEVAAALPTLLSSIVTLTAVAWFVRWPARLNWQTNASMVLAATLPLDVGLRSVPGATYFASGFLAVGTVCMLQEARRRLPFLGAAVLSLGVVTHEVSFFYVAILCLTALALDRERFWRPVLTCIAVSGLAVTIESATYGILLGDPLARFRVLAATTTALTLGQDPDAGISGLRFFTWPVENLLFGKPFGLGLFILLVSGMLAWTKLAKEQRILFVATFLACGWLGYGTQVPWAYKPFYRQIHYYGFAVLGIAALIPAALGHVFAFRRRLATGVVTVAVLVHLGCLAAGGRWGQEVDVSRELLRYATDHRGQTFLTDVFTMNQIYVLSGFQIPQNVVCINGPAVKEHLLLNKEPAGSPRFRFPEARIDGLLINLERLNRRAAEAEGEFVRHLEEHGGDRTRIAPLRYKILFTPILPFIEPADFMVRSLGGEVMRVTKKLTKPRYPPISTGETGTGDFASLGFLGRN